MRGAIVTIFTLNAILCFMFAGMFAAKGESDELPFLGVMIFGILQIVGILMVTT